MSKLASIRCQSADFPEPRSPGDSDSAPRLRNALHSSAANADDAGNLEYAMTSSQLLTNALLDLGLDAWTANRLPALRATGPGACQASIHPGHDHAALELGLITLLVVTITIVLLGAYLAMRG